MVALFPLECSILLIESSDPLRTKIVPPLYRQPRLGLTLSLMMMIKIALFSTGEISFSSPVFPR